MSNRDETDRYPEPTKPEESLQDISKSLHADFLELSERATRGDDVKIEAGQLLNKFMEYERASDFNDVWVGEKIENAMLRLEEILNGTHDNH